jgi:hypothetical protein
MERKKNVAKTKTTKKQKSFLFSHSPIAFANLSFINLVSIFRCSSSKTNPVYGRRVNSFVLVLVFHHTDTSLYLLSMALALSIHNKLSTQKVFSRLLSHLRTAEAQQLYMYFMYSLSLSLYLS